MLDMIKCSTGGAYYARGEWVPADGEASAALAAKGFDAAAIENAKTGTMAYSILASSAASDVYKRQACPPPKNTAAFLCPRIWRSSTSTCAKSLRAAAR